eukprot:1144853-Pelagomonas_calceolata.AAC.11
MLIAEFVLSSAVFLAVPHSEDSIRVPACHASQARQHDNACLLHDSMITLACCASQARQHESACLLYLTGKKESMITLACYASQARKKA